MEFEYVNGLTLLNAKSAYRQTLLTRVHAEATCFGDTLVLFGTRSVASGGIERQSQRSEQTRRRY